MRVISSKKAGAPVLLIGAAVIMVLIVVVTLAVKGIINIPGLSPKQEEAPVNTMQVLYTNGSVGAGTYVKDATAAKDIAVGEYCVMLDDVVLPSELGDLDGYVTKIDLAANTPLTKSMICPVDTDNNYNDTTREVDISYVNIQSSVAVGDYIDIRLKTSSDQNSFALSDDIVLAKKEIIALNGSQMTLRLNEDEQILLTAAAVDMAITNSARQTSDTDARKTATLYTTAYVSNAQRVATITYSNSKIVAILKNNPNLINNPTGLYEKLTGQKLEKPIGSNQEAIAKDIDKKKALESAAVPAEGDLAQ